MFSANLRLHISFSRTEKEANVEAIIQELGLSECSESLVIRLLGR